MQSTPALAVLSDPRAANLGLGTWPHRRARISPHRVALSQGPHELTYAQLAARASRLAGVLSRLGVGRGDRVAYLGANDIATFETLFATGLLGAVLVPLNTRLTGPELGYLLHDCTPRVLVHSRELGRVLAGVDTPAELIHRLELPAEPGVGLDLDALAPGPDRDEPVAVALDDPALILYTSGTTGHPKGAVLTHGNITWNTLNQLAHIDVLSDESALCIAPLFHVVGLGQITLPTLLKGGRVEVLPRFDAETVLRLITERRVTSFSAVPTMLQMMTEHPTWEQTDLGSLRCVVYGGSAIAERVARAWLERGVQVVQGFGMTEAAPGVYLATHEGAREHPVAIGLPHFFVDVAHLGEVDGAPAPVPIAPDERAELLVRGPNVFAGYWNQPGANQSARVAEGWFRTGDVVTTAADGWSYAVDRVKDMIISGGENIYPAEVEAVITELPAVAGCAVVAVADDRWGEVGAAYVQLHPGVELDEAHLRAHLEANLARYKIPKFLHFVADLPRNATGKIQRAVLRSAAADEHAEVTS